MVLPRSVLARIAFDQGRRQLSRFALAGEMVFGLTDRPDLESMAKLNNLARLVKIICRGKVVDRHYTSYDHAITIYHKPSIDTNRRLHKANGMLVPFTDDGERC